jgi:hypothetical protein
MKYHLQLPGRFYFKIYEIIESSIQFSQISGFFNTGIRPEIRQVETGIRPDTGT